MQLAVNKSRPFGSMTQTTPDRVYRELRERIINFDLPPGTTLSRNKLTREFGVSQTPVREALQRLVQQGLVLIYPQSKTIVSRIDVRQLSETQFLRVSIETEVVRKLASGDKQEAVRRAQAILDMQKVLTDTSEDMPMFNELDRSFHLTLFEGVGMENLHSMLLDRFGHLHRGHYLELPRKGKMQTTIETHQAILDGVLSGDPETASEAMREHLSGAIKRLEALRAEFPNYFTEDAFRWGDC